MKLYLNSKRNVHWWVSNVRKLCLLLVMWGSALTLSESLLDNLFSVKSMDCNRLIRDTQQPAAHLLLLSKKLEHLLISYQMKLAGVDERRLIDGSGRESSSCPSEKMSAAISIEMHQVQPHLQ